MNSDYLFSNHFKRVGWLLLIPGIMLGLYYLIYQLEPEFLDFKVFSLASNPIMEKAVYFSWIENNILDEIIGLLIIIGAIFIAFSEEKVEDELISRIRLESLVWATYVNYAILILTILFIYDLSFFWVLVFNMFTVLFFFIFRFNWAIKKSINQIGDEK